jgi:hypothetical protein
LGGRFLGFEDFSFIFVEEKFLCAINIGSQNKMLSREEKKGSNKIRQVIVSFSTEKLGGNFFFGNLSACFW